MKPALTTEQINERMRRRTRSLQILSDRLGMKFLECLRDTDYTMALQLLEIVERLNDSSYTVQRSLLGENRGIDWMAAEAAKEELERRVRPDDTDRNHRLHRARMAGHL